MCIFVPADVTSDEESRAAVEKIVAAFGTINVAINCAGVADPGKVLSKKGPMSLAFFNRVVQINLVGTLNIIRLAVEQMVKNTPNGEGEKGVIINTASVAAFDGQIGQAAYSASKAGVVGMTLPIAQGMRRLWDPRHDHRPGALRHAHDGGPSRERPGAVGADRALPETPRQTGGICGACPSYHRESDAQRRVHPPRRGGPDDGPVRANFHAEIVSQIGLGLGKDDPVRICFRLNPAARITVWFTMRTGIHDINEEVNYGKGVQPGQGRDGNRRHYLRRGRREDEYLDG